MRYSGWPAQTRKLEIQDRVDLYRFGGELACAETLLTHTGAIRGGRELAVVGRMFIIRRAILRAIRDAELVSGYAMHAQHMAAGITVDAHIKIAADVLYIPVALGSLGILHSVVLRATAKWSEAMGDQIQIAENVLGVTGCPWGRWYS